jgi:hypothetical protein
VSPPDQRRAFGISILAGLALPALPPLSGDPGPAPTRVTEVASLAGRWPADAGERVVQEGAPGTAGERFVDRHPTAGHRLRAEGYGEALIAPDGRTVTCTANGASAARLQRLLVGRVLPWAALLQGRELLHAAAVRIDGRAIVLAGPSGAGKTSLAVRLVLAGAALMSDDVLAVEARGGGPPIAHPGARAAGLRAAELARFDGHERAGLGELTELDGKTYASFDVSPAPAPIGAVVFVTRPPRDPGGPAIRRLAEPSAQPLLASAFVTGVRTPERLARLLEVTAAIARTAPQYRVVIRPAEDARTVAGALRAALHRDR